MAQGNVGASIAPADIQGILQQAQQRQSQPNRGVGRTSPPPFDAFGGGKNDKLIQFAKVGSDRGTVKLRDSDKMRDGINAFDDTVEILFGLDSKEFKEIKARAESAGFTKFFKKKVQRRGKGGPQDVTRIFASKPKAKKE